MPAGRLIVAAHDSGARRGLLPVAFIKLRATMPRIGQTKRKRKRWVAKNATAECYLPETRLRDSLPQGGCLLDLDGVPIMWHKFSFAHIRHARRLALGISELIARRRKLRAGPPNAVTILLTRRDYGRHRVFAIRSGALAAGLLCASWLAPAAIAADGPLGFAQHVPADACFVAYSGDLAASCEAFRKTSLGQSVCGEDFAPLVKELERLDRASAWRLRPLFGFDWNDLVGVREAGGVAIFPLEDGTSGVAWLFMPRAPTDQEPSGHEPAALAAARRYFQQKGYRATPAVRAMAGMTVLEPPPAHKSDGPRALFVVPGFYGVANSPEAAKRLLATSRGESLAANAIFKQWTSHAEQEKSQGVADVDICIRPFQLFELIARAERTSKDQAQSSEKQNLGDKNANGNGKSKTNAAKSKPRDRIAAARRLGFDALDWLAGSLTFESAEPFQWRIDAKLFATGPYRKAMRLLELKSGPPGELPDWIAADIVSMATWRWDFPQAMKAFGNLFDEANDPGPNGEGMFEDLLDGLRDDPEGVQVDLRRDLFPHLGPEALTVVDEDRTRASTDPAARRQLFVAAVRDEATVKQALARFYKGDDRVHHAQNGKYDLWTVEEGGSLFVEGETSSLVTVRALAVGQGRLLLGTHVDAVEEAINPKAKVPKLRDDPKWTRLLDWIKHEENERTALRSLLRLDHVIEPSYRLATTRQPANRDALGVRVLRLLLYGANQASIDFPQSVAPQFERLQTALPPTGMFVSQAQDGWTIHIGALGAERVASQ